MNAEEMFVCHVFQSFIYDIANILYSYKFNKYISIKTKDKGHIFYEKTKAFILVFIMI